MEIEVKKLLKDKIEDYFKKDGGGLEVISLENNILKIRMTGKCSNCPSAIFEMESFVFEEIKSKFPTIERIILVNDVSDEMINFAKKILNHEN